MLINFLEVNIILSSLSFFVSHSCLWTTSVSHNHTYILRDYIAILYISMYMKKHDLSSSVSKFIVFFVCFALNSKEFLFISPQMISEWTYNVLCFCFLVINFIPLLNSRILHRSELLLQVMYHVSVVWIKWLKSFFLINILFD